MDYRQIVATKLAEAGIKLSDDDLDQLAAAYPALLRWETRVQGMVKPETEPALVFRAKLEV
jgi:hypothetical protein